MKPEKSNHGSGTINRRKFFTRCAGCTAGFTLLTWPGLADTVLSAEEDKSKEDILKELGERAKKFMPKLRSCSKVSFAALNEQFKLEAGNVTPALMAFTGGIAMRAETCGAVNGSILALGFFFESRQKKMGSSMKFGGLFIDRFIKEFTSITCREIQRHLYGKSYDFRKPKEQMEFMAVSQKTKRNCSALIIRAVQIAGDIILQNS
jgi:C_GCAxxG_C_C family probable redox protein